MTKKRNIFHNRRKTFRMKGGGYYGNLLFNPITEEQRLAGLADMRKRGITRVEELDFKKLGDIKIDAQNVMQLWEKLNTKQADAIQRQRDLQLGRQALDYNQQVRDLIGRSEGEAADAARAAAEAAFNQQFGQQLASVGLNQQAAAAPPAALPPPPPPPLPPSPPPEAAVALPQPPRFEAVPTVAVKPGLSHEEKLAEERKFQEETEAKKLLTLERMQRLRERKEQQQAIEDSVAARAGLTELERQERTLGYSVDGLQSRVERFTKIIGELEPLRIANDALKVKQRQCEEALALVRRQLLETEEQRLALQTIQDQLALAVSQAVEQAGKKEEELEELKRTAGENDAAKQQQILALGAFIKQTREQVDTLEDEIRVNKQKLTQKSAEIGALKINERQQRGAAATAASAVAAALVEEKQQLQAQLTAALAESQVKAQENDRLTANLQAQQTEATLALDRINAEKARFEEELRIAQANLVSASDEKRAELEAVQRQAESQLATISANELSLLGQLDVAQQNLQQNQAQRQRLAEQAEQLTREKNQFQAETAQAQAAAAAAEREKVQAQTAAQTAEREKLQEEERNAQSIRERDDCLSALAELQGRYNLLEESKRNELLAIQQQLDGFQARNVDIDKLNGKLEGLKTQLENVQLGVGATVTNAVFDARVQSLKAEIQTINTALNPLVNLQGESNRALSAQFTSLAGTVQALHTALQAQTASISQSLQDARSQPELDLVGQAALQAQQAAVQERARELADTQQEIRRLEEERARSGEEYRRLKSVSDGLTVSLQNCQTELAAERRSVIEKKEAATVLQQALNALIAQQNAKDAASELLQRDLQAKNAAVLAAQQREAAASSQASLAAQNVTAKQGEVTSLTSQLNAEKAKGSLSAGQIAELTTRLAALQAEKQAAAAAAAAAETAKNTAIREQAAATATQQGVAEALARLQQEKDASLRLIGERDAELTLIREQAAQAVEQERRAAAAEQQRVGQEHEAAIQQARQEALAEGYQRGYQVAQGEAEQRATAIAAQHEDSNLRRQQRHTEVLARAERLEGLEGQLREIPLLIQQLEAANRELGILRPQNQELERQLAAEKIRANTFEAALKWHRNPKLIINGTEITADTELNGTIRLKLTQRARKAVAFFEYEGFTDFVDVQSSGEIPYTVKPGLQGVGAFNIKN